MKTKTWILVGGAIVLVILGLTWWFFSSKPPVDAPGTSSSMIQVASTTSDETTSTAAATSTKPAPKPLPSTQVSATWTNYLKAFACVQVTLPATTKVNSFRQEGMPVAVGTQTAYKCNNGHTWVY